MAWSRSNIPQRRDKLCSTRAIKQLHRCHHFTQRLIYLPVHLRSCHHTHLLLILRLLDRLLLPVSLPSVLPALVPSQTYPVVGPIRQIISDSLKCDEWLCPCLVPLPCRCISKPPPWPSPSACRPPSPWGCFTCRRSTSSSSTPSRTCPNGNAASRWVPRLVSSFSSS